MNLRKDHYKNSSAEQRPETTDCCRHHFTLVVFDRVIAGMKYYYRQLLTMDLLALATMKNAVKCDI